MSHRAITMRPSHHKPARLSVPPPRAIALHKLPAQLRMLVRIAGEAAAFRLVEDLGGTPVRIPSSLGDAGWLVDMVGQQPAAALVMELGAQDLQLPKYDSVMRQLRHRRVVELRTDGMALAQVALATGYTVRQVINICNRNELGMPAELRQADDRQLDMFGGPADDQADPGAPATPTAHNPFGLAAAACDGGPDESTEAKGA
jgi:hypothetical protein